MYKMQTRIAPNAIESAIYFFESFQGVYMFVLTNFLLFSINLPITRFSMCHKWFWAWQKRWAIPEDNISAQFKFQGEKDGFKYSCSLLIVGIEYKMEIDVDLILILWLCVDGAHVEMKTLLRRIASSSRSPNNPYRRSWSSFFAD